MDPCLDDSVEFSKKLKKLGNDISIDILDGLPHGFLNFTLVSNVSILIQPCIWVIFKLFILVM